MILYMLARYSIPGDGCRRNELVFLQGYSARGEITTGDAAHAYIHATAADAERHMMALNGGGDDRWFIVGRERRQGT